MCGVSIVLIWYDFEVPNMKNLLIFVCVLLPVHGSGVILDNACGMTVLLQSYSYFYYSLRDTAFSKCRVHFDRLDYSQISLTISGDSLNSTLCQVYVNGQKDDDHTSKTGGPINSSSSFSRTVTSDSPGSLYLHINGSNCGDGYCGGQGSNCGGFGLQFTLKKEISGSPPSICSEYNCSNGKCVHDVDVCDGWNDCIDNSDESGCFRWSAGTYAGVIVGSVAFIIVVSAIVGFFYRRRRVQMVQLPVAISARSLVVTQSRW